MVGSQAGGCRKTVRRSRWGQLTLTHVQPASLRVICDCLRSYFRYRALQGDLTMSLLAALPRIANWRRATLPKTLSSSELETFLQSFDCTDPVGLRDYAIARCLVD
jgi:site-specific recombinase XerD